MGVSRIARKWTVCAALLTIAAGAAAQPGAIVVWGAEDPGIINVPAGTYWAADAGSDWCAGIRADRSLIAWGSASAIPPVFNVPSGTFLQVACGESFGVAIRTDGTLAAWGINLIGETNPPTGTFTKVDGGKHHGIGIRTNGTIAQWGNDLGSTPPLGQFLDVAAGETFSVGLHADGTLAAWGFDNGPNGQLYPPAGQFVGVAAGLDFGAALRADGSAVVWGNSFGNMALFTGEVRRISASMFTLYGLRADGTLTSNSQGSGGQPATGTFGTFGVGQFTGLAIVPAPATSLVIIAGGLITRRRRNI